jgi:radical S-adenosyl methionine domain-containing protein 2
MLQSLEKAVNSLAQNQQNIAFNIHLTGKCDMQCIGCYARFGEDIAPKPFSLSKTDWGTVINTIHDLTIGLNAKINFVGGEPLLYPHLPDLLYHTKNKGLTTSIVTNGSLLKRRLNELSGLVDWVGLSIDSFNHNTLRALGRISKGNTLNYHEIIPLVHDLGSKLKINTVISQRNWQENMIHEMRLMNVDRWKVFQFLPVAGENDHAVAALEINEDQFKYFCQTHESLQPVIENNDAMQGSYLMISPDGLLFDNSHGYYRYGPSLLNNIGPSTQESIGFKPIKFLERGGSYDWKTHSTEGEVK